MRAVGVCDEAAALIQTSHNNGAAGHTYGTQGAGSRRGGDGPPSPAAAYNETKGGHPLGYEGEAAVIRAEEGV